GGNAPLLVSNGRTLLADAQSAGDEPYLIARDNPAVPVAIGADRVAAARFLVRSFSPEVLVLDDAFQHRRLARDLDLLLLDGGRRFADDHRFRRRDLEEIVLEARRLRADVLVTTEKDLVRLMDTPEGSPPLYALAIQASFPFGPGLEGWLLDRLREVRPDRRM